MKRVYAVLPLLLLLVTACTKSRNSGDAVVPTTYRVDNITDIQMNAESGFNSWLIYNVAYVGPQQETVKLSFEDLPAGIVADTTSNVCIARGIPKFTAVMHLVKTDTLNRQGTYNIKLVATGSATGKKSYNLHLNIATPGASLPANSPTPCTLEQTVATYNGNYVYFHKGDIFFYGFDDDPYWDVEATLTCDNVLTIPRQTVAPDSYIEGSGTLTVNSNEWAFNGVYTYEDRVAHYSKTFKISMYM